MSDSYILVMVTVGSDEEAAEIGKAVVEEKLAACCNVVPNLRSIFHWDDKLCDESEVLCLFKTRSSLFDSLRDRIVELHSYEVPEVISVDIIDGFDKYLDWIDDSTK